MKKYFFVFCKEDLLLEKRPDGTYSIPLQEEPPTELKPWNNVMNVTPLGDKEVRTYRIEAPVTDSPHYEMCGKEVWPQLATAVIVLIHRGDEVLLVRAKNFRRDYFGLVAGFVETGETLEEAVAREALEETGVTITNIRYFGSQPWPYPCGLMVGFNADYVSGEIHLQQSEIVKGGWFGKDNLPAIPEKLSIARMLLDAWSGER